MYRWHRLAGPEGDGRHAYVNARGAFLGPGVTLVERATVGNGPGFFAPVARHRLEHVLSKGYGVPVDCGRVAGSLSAVANALNAGDGARAAMALLHAGLPPLPDEAAAERLAKADRAWRGFGAALGKYDPDQPRVPKGEGDGGQWTSGTGGDAGNDRRASPDGRPPAMLAQELLPFFARPPFVVEEPPETPAPLKEAIPRLSGKDGAKDAPSWARGQRPYVGENGRDFAKRLMDEKYGPGNWQDRIREYKQIQKYGDRSFRDPKAILLPDDEA